MNYERIKLNFADSVAVLTLNHPETLNAVSYQMARELLDAIKRLGKAESGARCLLLTGAGRGFCSGANLSDPERESTADRYERDAGKVVEQYYNPLLVGLRELRMPIVTAVNGPAAGVGMSFALMGDLVLAARSAYFLQAFRRIGLVPDGGATYLLPRLIGRARAMELSLLGERLPAQIAFEWGMINRVYDDEELMPKAHKLAVELASGPTVSLHLIRKLYWNSWDNSFIEQLLLERLLQKEAGQTEDNAEGLAAFFQKRPAQFKGR